MGWETVSEGGGGLSGGQVQRIALARAVAQRPAILLLDEATSTWSPNTTWMPTLSSLTCTRIVIAHRLSTIRNADTILVLEAGQIVERGSRDALLAGAGQYAGLIRHQPWCDPSRRPRCPSNIAGTAGLIPALHWLGMRPRTAGRTMWTVLRATLERSTARRKTAQALAPRSPIILRCASGVSTMAVAQQLGITDQTVCKCRGRFVNKSVAGLLAETAQWGTAHDHRRSGGGDAA